MAFADRLLVQGAEQAATIDRAVWQDQSMIVLSVTAARSKQFSRALAIARGMPRPEARSEALLRVAESLARVAALLRVQYGEGLQGSWQDLSTVIESAAALPQPVEGQAQDFGYSMVRQNLVDDIVYRIGDLSQDARNLSQVANQTLIQLEQNDRVRQDVASILGDSRSFIEKVRSMGDLSEALTQSLADLRSALAQQRDAGRSFQLTPGQAAEARTLPGMDDPLVANVRTQTAQLLQELEGLARPLDDAATPTYQESARAVASIRETDVRANAAYLLIDSLTAVGRFPDARAATRILTDVDRQYVILSQIAESQGRRGLADSARDWIAREAPPERQGLLYRSVAEGVMASLDQLRSRAVGDYPKLSASP